MSTRLLVASLVLLAPSVAAGQRTTDPPPHPREGLFGGFALHAGNISCEGDRCEGFREAGGVSGHAGWGLSPTLGGVLDLWVMSSKEDRLTLTHVIASAGVRYWLVPILWIQGGLGLASASWRYDATLFQLEDRTDNVPAIFAAVGLEVLQSPRFAIDVQLRLGYGFYDDDDDGDGRADQTARSASLAAGFTWF
jgi:hypothetical protein